MNKNVRKAFDMIINRKEIAKDVSKIMLSPSGPFNHRLKTVENGKVQNQDIKKRRNY